MWKMSLLFFMQSIHLFVHQLLDCLMESQVKPIIHDGNELSTLSNCSTDNVKKFQTLIQRQTETTKHLKQLNGELLKLLHEEWSITGTVPPGYESLCTELGICNKPLKNTSYPLSHVLVHKASSVSMKQEYYTFLQNKRKYSTLATMKPTQRLSIRSESSRIETELDGFPLPDDEIAKRYQKTTRRLVEVFGRSISTELFPNKPLHNIIDSNDICSNSNSSTYDCSTINLPLDKQCHYKRVRNDHSLTPIEYYHLNHMTVNTSISDYSSFLSTDYSPTPSLKGDYKSLRGTVNKIEAYDILSDLCSNLSTNINNHNTNNNQNMHKVNDESTDGSIKQKGSLNEGTVESEELEYEQQRLQLLDGCDEDEEDIRRATYEIELRRLEVDFAVISQLYAVHKQRAKETKCESYKIAYKSNSKKLKDITEQMNHIKTVLLSNNEKSEDQMVTPVNRRITQKQIFKRRRIWNPLKMSTSNWTVTCSTSPRLSKQDASKLKGYSSPATPNIATKISSLSTKVNQDCFTELRSSTVVGRKLQNVPPRHSSILPLANSQAFRSPVEYCNSSAKQEYEGCSEPSNCRRVTKQSPTKLESNKCCLPDLAEAFSVTPIKEDVPAERRLSILAPESTISTISREDNNHHSAQPTTINPLVTTSLDRKIMSPSKSRTVISSVQDRRKKYAVKTLKRSQSLSSELFILSVDDTCSLPRVLMNKIARIRSLPHFNTERTGSDEYFLNQTKVKNSAVPESYSVDGKLMSLKMQPTSTTTQSSGIGLNNSSASVTYRDNLRTSNSNCLKCVPKKVTSSNTSSSNWSSSGCSCLSSQTTNSSPYEEIASKPNCDISTKLNQGMCLFNEVNPADSDENANTPVAHNLAKTIEAKVLLRRSEERGRRIPVSLTEVTGTQAFGMSLSAKCICSCLLENGHMDLQTCQCSRSEYLIMNNTPSSVSTVASSDLFDHDKQKPVSLLTSVGYNDTTQSISLAGDERLHSKLHLNCFSLQNSSNYDGFQENEESSAFQTPTNLHAIESTTKRTSSSQLGRLSLKPLSMIRRAVSKVATHSERRSLNSNSSLVMHQKTKRITGPTLLPSLATERLKDMNPIIRSNEESRRVKYSVNETQDSCSLSSNSTFNATSSGKCSNSSASRFTWARKLRHSIRPSHKCTN
ncbi:unnamed protein product [Heterobilharzia americana]|nr:unnamed protein product [Heterobilharzia americana]